MKSVGETQVDKKMNKREREKERKGEKREKPEMKKMQRKGKKNLLCSFLQFPRNLTLL